MSHDPNRQENAEAPSAPTIGARVRALRHSAGMTQEDLAADRFSKEYVSQIERGKTRPSLQALEWLAARLGTDREYLEHGVYRRDVDAALAALDAAEALTEKHAYTQALERYREARPAIEALASAPLALRLESGEAWALLRDGEVDAALSSLERGREQARAAACTDVDRALLTFRLGVCRYSRSEIPEAIALFTEALALADRSAADSLRADILGWRSRCHRRERDWSAAWDDVERALDVAEHSGSLQQVAEISFQASLVTHRQGRWIVARKYAEAAMAAFEELGDRATAARVLNNIAGLDHLLGDPAGAVARLQQAFATFVDLGLPVEAGYALSSQADIYLSLSDFERAETQARKALELLGDRVDHLQEVGTAQLALGRALAGQGRDGEAEEAIAAAERTFERARSTSHQADASIARGDLESSRGNDRGAASHFRQAVESLQGPETGFAGLLEADGY